MILRSPALLFTSALVIVTTMACSGTDGTGTPQNDGGAGNDSAAQNDSGVTNDSGVVPPDAKPVDVTFSASCPKVNPCGGAVVGTWDYTGVCIDDPLAGFKQQCPTATVQSQKGTVKGRVVFDALKVTRTSSVSYSASITVPVECSQGQCALVQQALSKSFDSATCKAAGGGCACDLALTTNANQADGYTVQGNQVKISDGSTYDYCVSGSKLSYVPSGSSKEQPGAYEMTKK